MPLAGFVVAQGKMNFVYVLLAGVIGTILVKRSHFQAKTGSQKYFWKPVAMLFEISEINSISSQPQCTQQRDC